MKLRILDTTLEGGEPKQYASSYLVNDVLAVDAGCLGFRRGPDDQARIRHILITHTHRDHITSLPMFIENALPAGPRQRYRLRPSRNDGCPAAPHLQ